MTRDEYAAYLQTPRWRQLSKALRESRGKCQRCSFPYELNVHHLNYERLGRENIGTDLCCARPAMPASIFSRILKSIRRSMATILKARSAGLPLTLRKRDGKMSRERTRSRNSRRTTTIAYKPRTEPDFRNVERGKRELADMIKDSQQRDREKQEGPNETRGR